jgi:hypothetical protein
LLFDAGPLGYGALAAHGHADALSLCLWAGEDLLIDPGTGSYHGDPVWREALRGTNAHNACQLNGRDQSERRGLFLWGNRARARLLAGGAQQPWFILAGSHDGYHGDGVPEVRRLIAGHVNEEATLLFVLDEFLGRDRQGIHVAWHLGRGRGVVSGKSETCSFDVSYPGGSRLDARVAVFGAVGWPRCQAAYGDDGEQPAWYAPRFEEREPEGRIAIDVEADLPAAVVTVMAVRPGTDRDRQETTADIGVTRCDGGVSCKVEMGTGGALRALVAHPLAPVVSDGHGTLRGRFAAWREGEASPVSGKAVVAGATTFRCGLMSWKSTEQPITGVLSALAPRADSDSPPTDQTGLRQ